jgi:hypothetical protein
MIRKPAYLICRQGRVSIGEFWLWEEAPQKPDQVRLDLHFAGEVITATADTFFDALADIRNVLEARGLRPRCLGASRNVYPSPMIRSMGCGDRAYRLKPGHQAKLEDIVEIFATDQEITPVSVEEQRQFYGEWLESLK